MHGHNSSALDRRWYDSMTRQLHNMQLSYFHQVLIYVPLPPSCVKMVQGFCVNLHVLESILCLPAPALGAVSAWSSTGGKGPGVKWWWFFIV